MNSNVEAGYQRATEGWDYLSQRRKDIDRLYDYCYSVLPLVFENLLRQGRLSEDDLHGFGEHKLEFIRRQPRL